MGNAPRFSNSTELVFCREDVVPQDVTRLLDLSPSKSVSVGDETEDETGRRFVSHLGIWKLGLPSAHETDTVEEQIVLWLGLLEPKSLAMKQLVGMGYSPYLDCQADEGALSLCIDPDLLIRLGKLGIALSVWLYERSK